FFWPNPRESCKAHLTSGGLPGGRASQHFRSELYVYASPAPGEHLARNPRPCGCRSSNPTRRSVSTKDGGDCLKLRVRRRRRFSPCTADTNTAFSSRFAALVLLIYRTLAQFRLAS